jgi:hypothetical protein
MKTSRLERGFWSPVFWLVVAGCMLSASVVAGPDRDPAPKDVNKFLGLWEGVDPLDGSPVRLSLSDIDNDGVLTHTLQEDFFTVCFNLGPTYSRGRGVSTGTATVASKDVLDVETALTCFDDNNVPAPQGVVAIQYFLRSRDRVLVVPPHRDEPPIMLHHVAP